MRTWRQSAAPIIAAVLKETKDLPEKEIKAALKEAYPFGVRAHHPYKVWLDEIKRHRFTKRGKAKNTETQHQPSPFE